MTDWAAKIREGDARALARVATGVENRDPQALGVLRELEPLTGHARLVGITGPPGAGKSTLVDALAAAIRKQGKTVAVLAVDPTSRRTGGAILGDRIRMQQHHADPGIFIRSMATRGGSGGLARATADLVRLMDAAGRDYVIIETVGVGQDEVEIAGLAQVTVVVLVPGMGDDVQTIKAGIMEIADIFVINKSDLPGADNVERELQAMLSLAEGPRPPILRTVARDGTGVAELLTTIEGSLASGASTARRAEARRQAGRPDPTQGTVVTLRVTDSAAAVETLRAAGLLLELIEESTP
jgi:LAO/AO transport system kinase